MKNFLVLIFCFSCMSSCIKDYKSTTYVKIKNNTLHKIDFKPYISGNLDSAKFFSLSPGSEITIENQNTWGKANEPIAFGEYYYGLDSVVVTWNDVYDVVYLGNDYVTGSKKIEYNDSINNFFHIKGYEKKHIKNHKKFSIWDLVFYFTEADYEFAKD